MSGPSSVMRASRSSAHFFENSGSPHAGLRLPVVVGRGGMQDRADRQVESGVEDGKAGEAARDHAASVVAPVAGDDLLLPWPADHVVVVPDQLHLGLVGIGAGEAEVHLAHVVRRQPQDAVGEADGRLVGMTRVGVEVGELLGLLVDGVRHLGAPVADVDAVEAGEGVDEFRSAPVDDADALARHHDAWIAGDLVRVVLQVGGGMQKALAVHVLERDVVGDFHDLLLGPLGVRRRTRHHSRSRTVENLVHRFHVSNHISDGVQMVSDTNINIYVISTFKMLMLVSDTIWTPFDDQRQQPLPRRPHLVRRAQRSHLI